DHARRDSEVRTEVGGDVRSHIADAMWIYGRVSLRTEVKQSIRRVGGWQIDTALALVLVEPRSEKTDLLGDLRVYPSRGVIGLLVAAEPDNPATRNVRTINRVVDKAFLVISLRIERDESKDPVPQDGAAKGESREHVAGLRPNGLVRLGGGVNV